MHSIRGNLNFRLACLALTSLLSACGGGSSTSTTVSDTTGTSSTSTGVLCDASASGTQPLTYTYSAPNSTSASFSESLAYNYKWSCTSTARTMTGNGVPNHAVTGGSFATKVSAQTLSGISMAFAPAATSTSTAVSVPAYALNSVKMEPSTAGTCTNTATSAASGCNYAGGNGGTWKMEAMADPSVSSWKFSFGTDENNAHVQPNGQYHYHGMPTKLITVLNSSSSTSMTLVGWAADGFPIYANLGYTTATDAKSALKIMKGSFRVKTAAGANRPSISDFPMGHFQQDWEFDASVGDLDECNGRTGVTPEYPAGIYHYYVTSTYPFIQRCVKGTAATWAK